MALMGSGDQRRVFSPLSRLEIVIEDSFTQIGNKDSRSIRLQTGVASWVVLENSHAGTELGLAEIRIKKTQ
jgi:hypothetical protein